MFGRSIGEMKMTSSRSGSLVVKVVAVLMFAGSVVAPAAYGQGACANPHEAEPTRTFDVRVQARDDVYRVGDVIEFRVSVNRELDDIVLGPAEDAEVAIAVSLDGYSVWGSNVTDEAGKAVIRVRLKRFLPEGSADVHASAVKMIADLPCHSQYEYEFGSLLHPNFVDIAR